MRFHEMGTIQPVDSCKAQVRSEHDDLGEIRSYRYGQRMLLGLHRRYVASAPRCHSGASGKRSEQIRKAKGTVNEGFGDIESQSI